MESLLEFANAYAPLGVFVSIVTGIFLAGRAFQWLRGQLEHMSAELDAQTTELGTHGGRLVDIDTRVAVVETKVDFLCPLATRAREEDEEPPP